MAAQGWDTVLLDRHSFPRVKVCGEFLSPESRHSLAALGLSAVLEELQPAPPAIARIRLSAGSGRPLELPLPEPAHSVSRYALDCALQREAKRRGAQVRTGVTVRSIERGALGWRVGVRSREHGEAVLEARAVIGAWGRVAAAGLAEPPAADAGAGGWGGAGTANAAGMLRRASRWSARTLRGGSYVGVRVELAGVTAEPVVELYWFRGGYIGLVPMGNGTVNAAALVTPDAFRSSGSAAAGVVAAAALAVPALAERLRQAQPVDGSAAVTPVALTRVPRPWGVVPHIGDAAAVIPPLCGDGMAMGLHAASLCAPMADRYLRGTLTLGGWRAAYTETLQDDFAGPLRWGLLLQAGLSSRGLSPLLLRLGRFAPSVAYRFVEATRLRTNGAELPV
ncbi:NAD(P)/FAD-dependent oxidoreductase [Paenibacillus xylaniclasticus]|uniref:NAD(P)/FAD-dependent oxidoreductase n=1 Tax=Paenibacillus xylaniclasticus TaxID=588083 RepID=UPI001FE9E0AC|nr:FAD-dependent monooxygenase [Paenibacillus xylaniclasticus]